MHHSSLKKRIVYIALIGTLVALPLTGCMNNIPSHSSEHVGATPTTYVGTTPTTEMPTATTEPSQTQPTISLNQGESFDLSGLNIQAKALACPLDEWLYHFALPYEGGNVVLTDPSASFDDGSIAGVTASIDQNDPSLLPNGFTTVLAGFVDQSQPSVYACYDDLEITNTSQGIIQITQIALRYTADSQQNQQHYNLVDICSLPIQSASKICYGGRGAPGVGQIYSFQLTTGGSGTIISSQETQSLSIEPGETAEIELQISPADASNVDYIYSLVPQITLSTSPQPQELSQLTSTAVFMDSSSASCYQLQSDNTFLQLSNFTVGEGSVGVLDNQGNMVYPECV